MSLSEDERDSIQEFADVIAHLGKNVKAPMDPKVEPLLEVIYGLLQEQLSLEKGYEYIGMTSKDNLFDTSEPDPSIPDADELNSWLNDGLDDS